MRISWFVGAALVTLCVGLLATIGADTSADPFAAMSRLGAYLMILVAILGGVFLSLALSASAERKDNASEDGSRSPQR